MPPKVAGKGLALDGVGETSSKKPKKAVVVIIIIDMACRESKYIHDRCGGLNNLH